MAQTQGIVQRLTIAPLEGLTVAIACVWIGPTPTNTELLLVLRRNSDSPQGGAFKNGIVDALATALVGRREVVVTHDDTDSEITQLSYEPA